VAVERTHSSEPSRSTVILADERPTRAGSSPPNVDERQQVVFGLMHWVLYPVHRWAAPRTPSPRPVSSRPTLTGSQIHPAPAPTFEREVVCPRQSRPRHTHTGHGRSERTFDVGELLSAAAAQVCHHGVHASRSSISTTTDPAARSPHDTTASHAGRAVPSPIAVSIEHHLFQPFVESMWPADG
jgi:hypothetical protein